MALGIGPKNGGAAANVVNTDLTAAGPGGVGGLLSEEKDQKTKSTDANFGEVMKQFQAKFGAKPEKAREIKKTLGKDDFLRIMIQQMKNQDPTKPFNADEMAAQMAQYASVEQLQNVNQNIQKLQTDNKSAERMSMTAMIGKVVTVDREKFPHVEGQNESLVYALPKDAKEVKISIMSETGEEILQKDLGPQKAGEQSFSWDGLKTNTLPSKTGGYTFKIVAKDSAGAQLATNPKAKGKVIGVGFDGPEPFLLVGDAKNQQKVTMKNVTEIDEAPQQVALPFGNPVAIQAEQAAGTQPAPAGGGKFFSFKKGVGSENLDPSTLSPEAQSALAQYQAANAARTSEGGSTAGALAQNPGAASARGNVAASAASEAPSPRGDEVSNGSKGFPSGLQNTETGSGNNMNYTQ
jgi:flagellar basal-body rod modification protein FlgD